MAKAGLRATVEWQGLNELVRSLKDPKLIAGPLADTIERASEIAVREAQQLAPRDTGALARSITAQVQPRRARVYSPLFYGRWAEKGRRPGMNAPPPQRLAGWARRHGFPRAALFLLAQAIGRRGSKGRFFMAQATTATAGALPNLLQRMAREIERRWGR